MTPATFGPFLRQLRTERTLTQEQLAQLLHVSTAAVSKWERCKCLPDLAKLEDLAQVLDVTLLELLRCRRVDEPLAPNQLTEVYAGTLEAARSQGRGRLRRAGRWTLAAAALVLLLYFFPVYHIPMAWSSGKHFSMKEFSWMLYRGSPADQITARPILAQAEAALSDLSCTAEEAEEKYGPLSRLVTTTDCGAAAEKHELKLWAAHFDGTSGRMWVYYSRRALDARGNTLTGAARIPALLYLKPDETGRWQVTHLNEPP